MRVLRSLYVEDQTVTPIWSQESTQRCPINGAKDLPNLVSVIPCRPQWIFNAQWIFNDFPTSGHQHLPCRVGHYQRQNHLTHGSLPRIRTTHITPRKCTTKQFKDMALFSSKNGKKNTISCSLLLSSVVGTCQACQAGYRWLQARWATGLPASSSSISRICSYGSTEVLGPAWNFGGNSLKLGWNRLKHVETAEHQILF